MEKGRPPFSAACSRKFSAQTRGVPCIGGMPPASEMFYKFGLLYHREPARPLAATKYETLIIIRHRAAKPPSRQEGVGVH
jgi:hypothetical protein